MRIMNGAMLREHRVKATMGRLLAYMEKDKELAKFLTTPVSRLPKNYRYLIGAAPCKKLRAMTLLEMIDEFFKSPFPVAELSVSGGKLVGFIGYREIVRPPFVMAGDVILFSCSSSGNGSALAKDSLALLASLQRRYHWIEWYAIPGNPITSVYDRIVLSRRGDVHIETLQDERVAHYRLPGRFHLMPYETPMMAPRSRGSRAKEAFYVYPE